MLMDAKLGPLSEKAQISTAIVWSKLVSVVFPLYLIIIVDSAKVLPECKQSFLKMFCNLKQQLVT